MPGRSPPALRAGVRPLAATGVDVERDLFLVVAPPFALLVKLLKDPMALRPLRGDNFWTERHPIDAPFDYVCAYPGLPVMTEDSCGPSITFPAWARPPTP